MSPSSSPVALVVLDGWGHAAPGPGNAIAVARPKSLDAIAARGGETLLAASGSAVGLPEGVMGNSEVGHLTLGAGRVLDQDLVRIAKTCRKGRMENDELERTFDVVLREGSGRLHFVGLCSDAGVHSDLAHLEAMVRAATAAGVRRILAHCFTDGRDTPPDSARGYLTRLEDALRDVPGASIATVGGRWHGMDRDGNWERVETAVRTMVRGEGPRFPSAVACVDASHARGVTDEFVTPSLIDPDGTMRDGDAVVFFNFRADRARQLTRALTDPRFDRFDVRPPRFSRFVTMTEYAADLGLPVLFPTHAPEQTLGEVFAEAGWPQLRLAETEKYAHVTYFFNGGREEAFDGEERILVPSPRVATFDLVPEMAAREVTRHAVDFIARGSRRLLVMNLANADMVGHSGDLRATIEACRVVDECVGEIAAAMERAGGTLAVTADHGNAECLVDARGKPHTAHTTAPVPFAWTGSRGALRSGGLADVAPTLLAHVGLPVPPVMSGRSLVP